jgi:hypothetical protein
MKLCGCYIEVLKVQVPARCTVAGQLSSVSVQQVRALSALVRVLEVPMDEFPLQCPWCVPLPVPVVRFLIYSTYTTELYSSTVQKERADTNERTTNEIPFNPLY